jgi:hypothetical protein
MKVVGKSLSVADKFTPRVWTISAVIALAISSTTSLSCSAVPQTARVSPTVTAWLPPDHAGARYELQDETSSFVEVLDSGLYVNWGSWLKKTSHRVAPMIRALTIAESNKASSSADIICRSDGTIQSLSIDGQHHWPHRLDKQLSSLRFSNFPKGSHLETINLHFDLSQHFCTFVPQLLQIADTTHWQ